MDENQLRSIMQDEIAKAAQKAQYTVTRTSVHTHNTIDSPNLPQKSVIGFATLPGTKNGVASPVLLNGQAISFGDTADNSISAPSVFIYPLPIIYGFGTVDNSYTLTDTLGGAQTLTLTGTLSGGATSAVLNAVWPNTSGIQQVNFSNGDTRPVTFTDTSANISWATGLSSSATATIRAAGATTGTLTGNFLGTTGSYAAQFNNGEIRIVVFTNGSAIISWSGPLLSTTTTTAISIIANSRFHGGLAPYGTALIFRNDDDGVLQLWTRTQAGIFAGQTWSSVDLTLSILD